MALVECKEAFKLCEVSIVDGGLVILFALEEDTIKVFVVSYVFFEYRKSALCVAPVHAINQKLGNLFQHPDIVTSDSFDVYGPHLVRSLPERLNDVLVDKVKFFLLFYTDGVNCLLLLCLVLLEHAIYELYALLLNLCPLNLQRIFPLFEY